MAVSAATSLLYAVSHYGSVKEYSIKFEEYLPAVKMPITGVWPLQSEKLILKLQQRFAVAALFILCTLSKKSSRFKNTIDLQ